MAASAWDTYASLYDQAQGETGDDAHALVYDPLISQMIGDVADKRVLDAGCGNGYWTRRLARRAKAVVGIDSAVELVKIARAKDNPDNVRYEILDLTGELNLEDETFDLILCSMVLHYVPSIGCTVAQFKRLLAHNGDVVICVQHPVYQYHYRAQALAGQRSSVFPQTVSYFQQASLAQVTMFGKMEVLTYNRTIEDYVTTFTSHGFVLTDLREPQFSEALLEAIPRYREVSEVPRVILMKFRKNSDPTQPFDTRNLPGIQLSVATLTGWQN
jgi:ubiquinone/menaquinone biosynthesis C-methylase UbiE